MLYNFKNDYMKKVLAFVLLASLMAGCVSSKKYYQRGYYDMAINKSVKKLRKKPDKQKEIQVLKESYALANQKDVEQINFLKVSGEPDIWDKIFNLNYSMKSRQDLVKTLPANILQAINYKYVNYDNEIIEAKKRAAEYFYAHALTLLAKNDRVAARQAYYELRKVKEYYSSYKDVDTQLQKALSLGTSNVLFKMQNLSGIPLPPDFEDELTKISLKDINREWINYDTKKVEGRFYDYSILVNIRVITVSPEQLKEVQYTESKDVQDGWQYVLDKNGNVMKDSLGNDIKVPKMKTITCNIIETQQHKSAAISGSLDYIDNRTSQLIKTDPITAQSVFENISVVPVGDVNALKPETKKKIGAKPLPFPPDPAMILQTGQILKGAIKEITDRNSNILQ